MQLTITIKDSLIKAAIEQALENEVFENYDSATIKAAKIPKVSTMVKEIFANDKWQKELARRMARDAESIIEENIWDDVAYEIMLPGLTEVINKIEAVTDQAVKEEELAREAEEVKRMVKALERAGFKIQKA